MKTKKVKNSATHILFLDESTVHPALIEFFGYGLSKIATRYKALHNEALKKHGVLSPHLGILKVLEMSGPISQIDLGAQLGVDKASMVKCIDHLEKRGLVLRKGDLKDRRIKNVGITTKGTQLLKNARKTRQAVEADFLSPLNPDQQKALRKFVSLLLVDKRQLKGII